MATKPNCYKCIWRGSVPGSAHSSCTHSANDEINDDPMMRMMAIFGSVGRVPPVGGNQQNKGIKVVGDEYGIRSGWFQYPLNFDPCWLNKCSAYLEGHQKWIDKRNEETVEKL